MTRLTVDAATLARLGAPASVVEVCDASGCVVGYYFPLAANGSPPRSPFSDEEIERRRQQRTGRPLADVLRDLGRA